ncbi:transglutaminase domain-containing protein [bacterium]|nr:transglutaminase domain-containing protein [bacterium]
MKRTLPILLIGLLLGAPRAARAADDDLEKAIRAALGREHWYGLYLMDQKAGYARSQFVATQVDGRDAVIVRLDARMKMVALGRKQDMRITEERIYFRTGELHSVRNRFRADGSDVEATGVVQGDKLVLTTRTGALVNQKELPKPRENLRTALAAEELNKPDTPLGTRVTVWQFEPMMLKEIEAVCTLKERKTIVLNGVRTPVSVVELRLAAMGVTSQMLIDSRGVALEMQMGQAFTLRLEPEKQAKDIRYSADIVRLGCIRLTPPPKQVATLRELRLRVEGVREDMELISDERQTWTKQDDGTHLVVSRVPAFDPEKAAKRPVADERFAAELRPSLQVQSADTRIKTLAAKIVGDETNAYKAAVKLRQWVYKNLKKVGTAALSNAVETLVSGQGDCTEHTVLFVALARAEGIPARMTSGVTAIEGGEGLYFHAWPEVWVGQWVAMDPTLGQDVADATHIKFTQGAMEKQFAIVSFIGRLKAAVVPKP